MRLPHLSNTRLASLAAVVLLLLALDPPIPASTPLAAPPAPPPLTHDHARPLPLRPTPTPPPNQATPTDEPPRPTEARADHGAWPADGHPTLYTFVQLSDTHVGREKDHVPFAQAVEHINALDPQPAFVLITGDLTDTFTTQEVALFQKIVGRLRAPVHLVPGNHDEGFDPSSRAIRFYNLHFPQHVTPYAFDQGPVTYIGLDSQLFNARRRSPQAAAFADAQWQRLEQLLDEATARHQRIVLFHHIPFYPSWEPHRGVKPMWLPRHRDAWRELLADFHVEAELTGHFHRDELYVEGQTLLLNAPPISEKFDRNPSYRLFRVTDKGLTFQQVYFRPNDAAWTYLLDLHDLSADTHRAWLTSLDDEALRDLWLRRQTFNRDAPRWFNLMDRQQWRAHLRDPLGGDNAPSRASTLALLRARVGARH